MADQLIMKSGSAETAAFWQACGEGKLILKRCRACGKRHYYPRSRCPHCFSDDTDWMDSTGVGSVYSFSIVRRGDSSYVLALVLLEEGVTLLSHVTGPVDDALVIGQPVFLAFEEMGGRPMPVFRRGGPV